eukprot:g32113.t1
MVTEKGSIYCDASLLPSNLLQFVCVVYVHPTVRLSWEFQRFDPAVLKDKWYKIRLVGDLEGNMEFATFLCISWNYFTWIWKVPEAEYEVLLLQFVCGITVTLEEGQDGHVTQGLGGGVKMVGDQK